MPIEALVDQLHIARTAAALLTMNFGGDGPFEPRNEVAGLYAMVAALATAATTASCLASELACDIPLIAQATGIAQFMEVCSKDELYGGQIGFRQGDTLLCDAFYSIEMMLAQAMKELGA